MCIRDRLQPVHITAYRAQRIITRGIKALQFFGKITPVIHPCHGIVETQVFGGLLHLLPFAHIQDNNLNAVSNPVNLRIGKAQIRIILRAAVRYLFNPVPQRHDRPCKPAVSYTHLDVYKRQLFCSMVMMNTITKNATDMAAARPILRFVKPVS